MKLTKIIPILCSVLFIVYLCDANPDSNKKVQSSNIIDGTSKIMHQNISKYQNLYISGAACSYVSFASSIAGVLSENGAPLCIAGSFMIATPILIHTSHSKARHISRQLVYDFPKNDSLKILYNNSKRYYGFGFIPMGGAIVFSTLAMPTSILIENSTGPFFYAMAFICLVTRDVLWNKSMKGYLSIAQKAAKDRKAVKLSLSTKYDPNKKIGGLSFNIHF